MKVVDALVLVVQDGDPVAVTVGETVGDGVADNVMS